MLVVTAVWGWTFVLVKDAVTQYPTLPFLQIRFVLALAIMAVVLHRLPTRPGLRVGAGSGGVLAAGYLPQPAGLAITSPGNAGLITGLFVVLTPLLNRLFGAPIHWWTWGAVVMSLAGLVMLTGGPSGMNFGDLLVLACAVLFALHIVLLGRWSPGTSSGSLAVAQVGTLALLFRAGGGGAFRPPNAAVWVALGVTRIFASALAQFIETRVRRPTPA